MIRVTKTSYFWVARSDPADPRPLLLAHITRQWGERHPWERLERVMHPHEREHDPERYILEVVNYLRQINMISREEFDTLKENGIDMVLQAMLAET